jgi:hypothetical protein
MYDLTENLITTRSCLEYITRDRISYSDTFRDLPAVLVARWLTSGKKWSLRHRVPAS